MFSTPYSLKKRTGKFDLERGAYLQQLVAEYTSDKTDEEKKEQVLANLGNFAYDPINYEYFRRFQVVDLFLNNINEFRSTNKRNEHYNMKLLSFSIAGVCNLCLDLKNREYLLKSDLIGLVLYCLRIPIDSFTIEIILNILTLLIFILDKTTHQVIMNYRDENINFSSLITSFRISENKRLSNLANIFWNDCLIYC